MGMGMEKDMRTLVLSIILLIMIFVFWCQLLLCVTVWHLAENVSEINHRIQINKPIQYKEIKKNGKL